MACGRSLFIKLQFINSRKSRFRSGNKILKAQTAKKQTDSSITHDCEAAVPADAGLRRSAVSGKADRISGHNGR